jgi:hypothetical protein
MRGRKSAANPQPGVMNRVHRPRLTPAQEQLQAQYRPGTCQRCVKAGRRLKGSPYLLDPSGCTADVLTFYCTECGFFTEVQTRTD